MVEFESQITFKNDKLLIRYLVLMSIALNQATTAFGINCSFADLFLLILVLKLLMRKELFIPPKPLLCFWLISILVISTAVFFTPNKFSLELELSTVIQNYLKLVVVFGYWVVGYNSAKLGLVDKALKWFFIGSLTIGSVGFVSTVSNMRLLCGRLFFGNTRLRGFMNDPNYFSILQNVAIAYLFSLKALPKTCKCIAFAILSGSVLMSGSKTGTVTLLSYLGFRLIEAVYRKQMKPETILKWLVGVTIIIIIMPLISHNMESLLSTMSQIIPALRRILVMFVDPGTGVSGDGSGRDRTWKTATELIKISPILGVGIGTYTQITNAIWNYGSIAHNTYLQLAVEWGMPITVLFFFFIFRLVIKASFVAYKSEMIIVCRDTLIVFLIGSFAISLNNARLFWLVLGSLVCLVTESKVKDPVT